MKALFVSSSRIAPSLYAAALQVPGLSVEGANDERSALWLLAGGDYGVVVIDLEECALQSEMIAAAVWRHPPGRVIGLAETPVAAEQRRAAYGAGVWELVELPPGAGRRPAPGVMSAVRRAASVLETPTVLFVDDCTDITEGIGALIADEGYRVETARTAQEAVRMLGTREYALMITETRRTGADGFRLMREAARIAPDLPIVVLTARWDDATFMKAVEMGARACLWKLAEPEEILKEVLSLLGAGQERGEQRIQGE